MKTELHNYKVTADIIESNNSISKSNLDTAEQKVGKIYRDSNNSRIKKLTKTISIKGNKKRREQEIQKSND